MDILNTFVEGVMSPAAALQNAIVSAAIFSESEADASARAAARKMMFEDITLDEDTHTYIEKPDDYYEAPSSSSSKMTRNRETSSPSGLDRGVYGDNSLTRGRFSIGNDSVSAKFTASTWKPKPLFYSSARNDNVSSALSSSPPSYLYREQGSFSISKKSHLKMDYSYASVDEADIDESHTVSTDCKSINVALREIENMTEHLTQLEIEQEELKMSILPLFGHAFIEGIYSDSVWVCADEQRQEFEAKYCDHDVTAIAELSNYRRDCLILARKIQTANYQLYSKLNRKYLFRLVNRAVDDISSLHHLSSDLSQTRRQLEQVEVDCKRDRDFALELRIETAEAKEKDKENANTMYQMQRLLLRLNKDMKETVQALRSVAPRAEGAEENKQQTLHVVDAIAGMPGYEQRLLEVRSEVEELREGSYAKHKDIEGQLEALRTELRERETELREREREGQEEEGQPLNVEGELRNTLRIIEKLVSNEVSAVSSSAARRYDALAKAVEEERAAAAGIKAELHNVTKLLANLSQEQSRLESYNRDLARDVHVSNERSAGGERDSTAVRDTLSAHEKALAAIPQELKLLLRGSSLELKGQIDAVRNAARSDRAAISEERLAREASSDAMKKYQHDIAALTQENAILKQAMQEMQREVAALHEAVAAKQVKLGAAADSRQQRDARLARDAARVK